MLIPLWAVLGLAAAFLSTFVPLVQERFKAEPFIIVIWMKLCVIATAIPFMLTESFPTAPLFYLATFISAALWAVSDILYFRAIPKVGAGVVTRIVPATVIITFIVWVIIDAPTRVKYLDDPVQASLIAFIVLLSAFFAFRMTKCPVSWQGVRLLWFVLFATAIGPILDKLSIGAGETKSSPFAFMIIQALMMISLWLVYNLKAKIFNMRSFFEKNACTAGLAIGSVAGIIMILRTQALGLVENPAYLTVLLFTDALWVLLIYKIIGRKEESDIIAGLGIVFCALALILIKSF